MENTTTAQKRAYGVTLTYPNSNGFTIKDIAALNPQICGASVRNKVRSEVQSGKLIAVGKVRNSSIGRLATTYRVAN